MKKLKCYIAGPMRGYKDYNFPEFYIAEAMLSMRGHDVVSPARMDVDEGKAHWSDGDGGIVLTPSFTFTDAMRRDIGAICRDRDSIVLLPGWEQSEGANEELHVARLIGLDLYEYNVDGSVTPLVGS